MGYLRNKIRMVNSLTGGTYGCSDDLRGCADCDKCPLDKTANVDCGVLEDLHPEQIVADWCKEHPAKTEKCSF